MVYSTSQVIIAHNINREQDLGDWKAQKLLIL